jgi:hypothetical protein
VKRRNFIKSALAGILIGSSIHLPSFSDNNIVSKKMIKRLTLFNSKDEPFRISSYEESQAPWLGQTGQDSINISGSTCDWIERSFVIIDGEDIAIEDRVLFRYVSNDAVVLRPGYIYGIDGFCGDFDNMTVFNRDVFNGQG